MTKQEMINHEHKFKPYRKLMGTDKMAAQFMPFAALTGFDHIILETARTTVEQKRLLQDRIDELNRKLIILSKTPNALIKVTYFKPDVMKMGGKYLTKKGKVKKIDNDNKVIIFIDNERIYFKYISEIESDLFDD
ncbi:MAG: hypothetical protein MJ214_05650 [Bacilli bacterium]|nr:hypothetical protein [Bacilli bacterium]